MSQQQKLYAIHPGYIAGAYISVRQLVHLYQLDKRDYIVWIDTEPKTFCGRTWHNYIHLYPDAMGKYIKPTS